MSKFDGIIKQAKERTADPVEPAAVPIRAASSTATAAHAPPPAPSPAPPEAPAPRGPGRPRGKRSDPSFDQVTAYIPHDLYRRVRLALLEADQGQEFSELVGELLTRWLEDRPRG